MKRLLSILASVGLVATASTSVVSCTKKDQTPTYHNIGSIKDWSLANDNQIIAGFDPQNPNDSKWLILGTLANRFRNSEALTNDKALTDANMKVINDGLIGTSGTSATYQIHLENKENKTFTPSFIIRADSSTELLSTSSAVSKEFILNADFDNKIVSTLRGISSDIRSAGSDINSYFDIEKNSSTMMSLDSWMFDQLAAVQNTDKKISTPNLDKAKDSNVRFDSVKQELVMSYSTDSKAQQIKDQMSSWKNVLVKFNSAILSSLYDQLITKKVNESTQLYAGVLNDAATSSGLNTNRIKFTFTAQ